MNAEILLKRLAARYADILGRNFIGMYVHGSYAMGCFNPLKSDLDFIIVCDEIPLDTQKKAIMDTTVAFERFAPAKGLEMHVMLRGDCTAPGHPARFELHYSAAHTKAYLTDPDGYIGYMQGNDPDLAAHLTVMHRRGLAIAGPAVPEIFGEVPKTHYTDSVLQDLGWSEGDAMYHVLNRCRTLAFAAEDRVLSKKEGALWALEHIGSGHHDMIRKALRCYETDEEFAPTPEARAFCDESLKIIKNLLGLA